MNTHKPRNIRWYAAGALMLLLVLVPVAKGQFGADLALIITTLTQLNSTMATQVGVPLTATVGISQQQTGFQQNTMYPQSSISTALSSASRLSSVMQTSQQLFKSPLNSATLTQTAALEKQLLGGNPNNISSIKGNYSNVYGTLPASTAIPNDTRMAVDMNDAQAQASFKKAIQLDALASREEQLSQQMMQQLSSTSPGSASMVAAQAAAWNLQAHAYSQEGLAQLLRVSSAETAYSGYQVKHASATHQSINQSNQQLYNH